MGNNKLIRKFNTQNDVISFVNSDLFTSLFQTVDVEDTKQLVLNTTSSNFDINTSPIIFVLTKDNDNYQFKFNNTSRVYTCKLN